MRMLSHQNLIVALAIGVGLFSACRRDGATRWDVNAKAPLLKGTLTWSHFIEDSLLEYGSDGVLNVRYSASLLNFNLDTMVAIPDTVIFDRFEPPFSGGPINIPAGTSIINRNDNILLKTDGAQIRLARIESGTLTYRFNSYVNGALDVQYRLPGITLPNGSAPNLDISTEPGSPSQPWTYTNTIDLSNVEIDLSGVSGFTYNRLANELNIRTSPSGGALPLMGDDSVTIALIFNDVRVGYGKGYFGSFNRTVVEANELQNALTGGVLNLEAVSLELAFTNRVGADLRIEPHSLIAHGQAQSVPLIHALFNQPLNVTRATDLGSSVSGETYTVSVTNENSNIVDFLSVVPNTLSFDTDITLNPLGNVSGSNDFIYTDAPFDAALTIELPLAFSAAGLVLRDTLDVERLSEFPEDASVVVKVKVGNAYPLKISNLRITLLPVDADQFVLADFTEIAPGVPQPMGPLLVAETMNEVTLTSDQFRLLREGAQAIIALSLETINGSTVAMTGEEFVSVEAVIEGVIEVSYQ